MAGGGWRPSLLCPGARRAAWRRGRRRGTRTLGFGGEAGRALQGGGWRSQGNEHPAGCSGNFLGDTKEVRDALRVPARCNPVYPFPGHSTHLTICATFNRAPWVRGYTRSSSPSEGWPGPCTPSLLHVVRMSPDPCDIAQPSPAGRLRGPGPPASKAVTGRGGASGAGLRVPLPSCGRLGEDQQADTLQAPALQKRGS